MPSLYFDDLIDYYVQAAEYTDKQSDYVHHNVQTKGINGAIREYSNEKNREEMI